MNLLVIDTSAGSTVALVGDAGEFRGGHPDPRSHAEQLALALEGVLQAGPAPEAVVVGTGPAPFTGLRAGIVTARAFAFARGLPLWGVPSLDAIARLALDADPLDADLGGEVTVATDARRKEVYGASYRANGPDDVTRIGDFYVGPPAGLPIAGRLFGDVELYPDVLHGERGEIDPACMARIARARAAAGTEQPTEPLYLRRPDAQVPSRLSRATTAGGAGTTGSPSAAPPSKEAPSGG